MAATTAIRAEKPPLVLAPSSPWNLDYADDSCRMTRVFGKGDEAVGLSLERFRPGDTFAMGIAGKPLASFALTQGALFKMRVRFVPEAEQESRAAPTTTNGRPGALITRIALAELVPIDQAGRALDQITPQRESAITRLEVTLPSKKTVILNVGSMGPPMAAMRSCINELLTHWGIDVARHATLTASVEPTSNPGQWLRTSDYPRAMVNKGAQALIHFRLMVGPDGVPTSCHIQRDSLAPEFHDAVCKSLMKRARFSPARDAAGQPMASWFNSSVLFKIQT